MFFNGDESTTVVLGLSFSPDHRKLAIAAADGTIKLWKISNLQQKEQNLQSLQSSSCQWLRDYLAANLSVRQQFPTICTSKGE